MAAVIALTLCEITTVFLAMYNPFFKRKWLIAKVLNSLLFLSVGIAAVLHTKAIDSYSWRMLVGLMFGVIGDFLLEKKKTFLAGSVSFAIGHIMYLGAFIRGFEPILYKYWFFLIIFAAVYAAYVVAGNKAGLKMNGSFLPLALYSIALIFMCVTAVSRAVLLIIAGEYLTAAAIATGGILFVVSDSCLGVSMFSKHKVHNASKIIHLTYFPAQTLFALSILFAQI